MSKLIVVKFGGNAMSDNSGGWISQIKKSSDGGDKFVIVHGGGPQIDAEITAKGLAKTIIGGYRVTTPEIFSVVEMILTGTVLRELVRSLKKGGLNAVGITGSDGSLLTAVAKQISIAGKNVELGQVGEVESVNPAIVHDLLDAHYLPVISPISNTAQGLGMNINADIAAGAIAGALGADSMIFMTDVPGIYRNWPDKNSLIASISKKELRKIEHTFAGGMAPKVAAALNALESGSKNARVIDGRDLDAFVSAITDPSDIGVGTLVQP